MVEKKKVELTEKENIEMVRIICGELDNLIPENTPHSIASGIVYFVSVVCNLNINKKTINNISEISEVTINKCYKKLSKLQSQLIPKSILEKYNN